MSIEPRFRSLGVLHPTFESWGGAEWFITSWIATLAQRHETEVTIYCHAWTDPPGGGRPPCRVVEHRRGALQTGPWDWRRVARELAPAWRRHDVLLAHNFPASLWLGEGLKTGPLPPSIMYFQEPPDVLYPKPDRPLESASPPLSTGRAAAALARYGTRLPWRLLSRLRSRLLVRLRGEEHWLELARELERVGVRAAFGVVGNSRFTAGKLEKIYGREVDVVHPLMSDLEAFRPTRPHTKERLVLFVGRLLAGKRPLDLLEAWIEARRRNPRLERYRLELVGDGPLRPLLLERARAAGLAESVGVVSGLSRAELIERYRKALCTVHLAPSEPFGLVPVESMAAGTPVLAHADGGVLETVIDGQTGWCVRELSSERLAELLTLLPAREAELHRLGLQAAAHVREHLRYETSFEGLVRLLNDAVGAGRESTGVC